jgi:hypothetical protein
MHGLGLSLLASQNELSVNVTQCWMGALMTELTWVFPARIKTAPTS